jgi:hypothetical protein
MHSLARDAHSCSLPLQLSWSTSDPQGSPVVAYAVNVAKLPKVDLAACNGHEQQQEEEAVAAAVASVDADNEQHAAVVQQQGEQPGAHTRLADMAHLPHRRPAV